jgi:DNA-binding XRE family transcriptional regulator
MDNQQELELLEQLGAMIAHETIKRDLNAVAHKLRYPMVAIVDKVPGEGVGAKAKAIGVSRQMIYVWMAEKARPDATQARMISKLTGIPADHILANGFKEDTGDTRRKRAKARGKLAKDGASVSARPTGTRAKSRRVAAKPSVGGSPRKVRKRTRRRLGEPLRGGAGA